MQYIQNRWWNKTCPFEHSHKTIEDDGFDKIVQYMYNVHLILILPFFLDSIQYALH